MNVKNVLLSVVTTTVFCLGMHAQAARKGASTMSDPHTIHPEILRRYCGEAKGSHFVTILRNDKGEIGGYTATRTVMDSPVVYMDAEAKSVGAFHIFGSKEENNKVKAWQEHLKKNYPVTEKLSCPEK